MKGGDKMKLYSVDETAELLGLSPLTIRKWLRADKLKGTKVGKSWRISDEELKRLFPEGSFFGFIDESGLIQTPVKVAGNDKLFQNLYPEGFEQYKAVGSHVDSWEEFKEKTIEDIERRFPYPLEKLKTREWNEGHTDFKHVDVPDEYVLFYSEKHKEEIDKFNRLLEMLQKRYGLKEDDIFEVKRTAENITLLTCAKEIFKMDY